MAENDIRKEVSYFMRRAYERGLTTSTGGNISSRVGDKMYITCSSKDKSSLSGDDIAIVDIKSGKNLTPQLRLSIESDMHRLLYLEREDIGAIVHSHPTFSCLFSASEKEIDSTLIAESWYLLDRVERIPYQRMGTKELAKEVSSFFSKREKRYVALLENHGAIALGKDLLAAFDRMECLEQAAKMTLFASSIGAKGLDFSQLDEIAKMRG